MCLAEITLMYDFNLRYLVKSHPDNRKGRTEEMLKMCLSSLVIQHLLLWFFFKLWKDADDVVLVVPAYLIASVMLLSGQLFKWSWCKWIQGRQVLQSYSSPRGYRPCYTLWKLLTEYNSSKIIRVRETVWILPLVNLNVFI